jgi:hypothetical protein
LSLPDTKIPKSQILPVLTGNEIIIYMQQLKQKRVSPKIRGILFSLFLHIQVSTIKQANSLDVIGKLACIKFLT